MLRDQQGAAKRVLSCLPRTSTLARAKKHRDLADSPPKKGRWKRPRTDDGVAAYTYRRTNSGRRSVAEEILTQAGPSQPVSANEGRDEEWEDLGPPIGENSDTGENNVKQRPSQQVRYETKSKAKGTIHVSTYFLMSPFPSV